MSQYHLIVQIPDFYKKDNIRVVADGFMVEGMSLGFFNIELVPLLGYYWFPWKWWKDWRSKDNYIDVAVYPSQYTTIYKIEYSDENQYEENNE